MARATQGGLCVCVCVCVCVCLRVCARAVCVCMVYLFEQQEHAHLVFVESFYLGSELLSLSLGLLLLLEQLSLQALDALLILLERGKLLLALGPPLRLALSTLLCHTLLPCPLLF